MLNKRGCNHALTTLEIKEILEIGLYKMPDDQGPKYFPSAEEVRLPASDWLGKRHNGGSHCTCCR